MAIARAKAQSTLACAIRGGLVTTVKLMWMNVEEVCLLFLSKCLKIVILIIIINFI